MALNPSLAEAYLNRGGILMSRKRYEEALGCFDSAIRINQNYGDAYCNRGNALEELKRFDEALASYDAALAISPKNAEFHAGRANVLHYLKRYDEALAGLSVALSLRPGNAAIPLQSRQYTVRTESVSLRHLKHMTRRLNLEPDHEYAETSRLQAKMHLCNWQNFDAEYAHLILSVKKEILSQPFALLAVSASADVQLKSAMVLSKAKYSASQNPMWRGRQYRS